VLAAAAAVALAASFGAARGHDAPHDSRPSRRTAIDPAVAYPARLVAAGGGHFHAILVGPAGGWLLAGTHLGLFRSVDRGVNWRLVASRFSGEDVHALVRDTMSGNILAATHGQGLVTSADGGRTWRDDSTGLPTRDLHALALDARQPARVYVWAVGHGLLRRDGPGERWQRLGAPSSLGDVRALAVHPNDSRRLYAATAKGVWVSSDGGHDWEQPAGGLRAPAAGIATLPGSHDVVLAATDDGVFVGDAAAARWRPVGAAPQWWGPLVAFTLDPARRDIIGLSHEGIVARRLIEGAGWTPLADPPRGGQPLSASTHRQVTGRSAR
jgi:hypothetical protein